MRGKRTAMLKDDKPQTLKVWDYVIAAITFRINWKISYLRKKDVIDKITIKEDTCSFGVIVTYSLLSGCYLKVKEWDKVESIKKVSKKEWITFSY